ncbi:hypothetical protein EJ06DRAFT_525303 [Trichodelitschia bisporula]|uniref:Uncharacterized protein n=1 Tax=Trichodelitschia bisporula TaxID=703511 RepID=A0A6G1HI28_9PEZI|nr:hypothetical protein EJ06DRAFT_525303 [Trichodelitschia bisporula]
MKLILALAALAAAHPFERRQSELSSVLAEFARQGLQEKKPFKKDISASSFPRPGAKKAVIWYGPYKIRAANYGMSMDPAGTAWTYLAGDFPKDVTVLQVESEIVYADGTRAQITNGLYNHHLAFVDSAKGAPPMAQCLNGVKGAAPPTSVFMGGSEDAGRGVYATKDPKLASGYYIGKADTIVMSGDIVNYANETKTVYTKSTIEYLEGRPAGTLDVSIQLISVTDCDGAFAVVDVPKNATQFTVASKEMQIVQDGYMVTARGHLHDGGVNVTAIINGKSACSSAAVYGAGAATHGHGGDAKADTKAPWDTISEMTYCEEGVKLSKGDKLSLVAHYDVVKHPSPGGSKLEARWPRRWRCCGRSQLRYLYDK